MESWLSSMLSIFGLLFLCFVLVSPLIITLTNLMNLVWRHSILHYAMTVVTMVLGFGLSCFLCLGITFRDYTEAIYINSWEYHTPISPEYGWLLLIILIWFFISWICLSYSGRTKNLFPPLVTAFFIAGIYAGWILCIVYLIQIAGGMDFVWFYLCLLPVNLVLLSVHSMFSFTAFYGKLQAEVVYSNPLLNQVNQFLAKGNRWLLSGLFFLVILLPAAVLLLELFGQRPDVLIKAFTETSDWTLSQQISPPPLTYDAHYLCTVSLRGHKKIVKPIRYGIRRGEKIVVNRQLCVANAFEQLIEERTPRLHRAVRNFYDKYGYPVSRHITTPLAADITYLIMKPLELVFLAVLYTVDKKPEDRIALQYLGVNKKQIINR